MSALAKLDPVRLQDPAIPPGSWIIVTGVNGFIGSHIADQLLAAGYKVRGSVRSAEKNKYLIDLFAPYGKENFELVEVPDITVDGAFDKAAKGAAGVIHVATVLRADGGPQGVIDAVIDTSVNMLKTAMKEPPMKRFVYTSSSTAAYLPKPNTPMTITAETWNDEAVEIVKGGSDNPKMAYMVYSASKMRGEQELWKWFREHRSDRPDFSVNTVLPNANFGRMLDVANQDVKSTVGFAKPLWDGDMKTFNMFLPSQYWIDVQDDARIHVAALLCADVNDERVFAFAETFTANTILQGFRKVFPDRKFPDDVENPVEDLAKVPNERALELLRRTGRDGWTPLEQSLEWMGKLYMEAAK